MKRIIPMFRLFVLVIAFGAFASVSPGPIAASGPIKQWSGIHLGNRPAADWNSTLLARIDGDRPGVTWPKAVVFLSSQLYDLSRDANCRIKTGANDTTTGRPVILDYLQRASQNGVRIIIRVYPSPGNFDANYNLWVDPIPGIGYCDWNNYRPAYDIADEMVAIHNYNQAHGITEWGFEPANEPNTEWYTDNTLVKPWHAKAWQDMNAYFKEIWLSVPASVHALTPPMAQARFAETKNVNAINDSNPDTWCPDMRLDNGSTGYDVMQDYYSNYNDGINWHNYWRLGFEWSGDCSLGAQHVSYFFPQWMKDILQSGSKPGTITEADLFSSGGPPNQDPNQPLQDKDDRGGWPAANSLRKFITNEFRADTVVAWLLNDNVNDPNQDHNWHEAYDDQQGNAERDWFTQWWPNFEHWTPPVYLADVRSDDAGWDSEILIQNVTGFYPNVTIDLFDDGGTHAGHYTCSHLDPNATCVVNPTNTGFNGWAVVSAEWNVAAVTLTRNGYELTAYNGILSDDADIGDIGDPGWERAGATLYAPMIKRNHPPPSGRSSLIYVVNVGTKRTTAEVFYYLSKEGQTNIVGTDNHDLDPGDRWLFLPSDVINTGDPNDSLFSAFISSDPDQPLAAVVMEYSDEPGRPNRTTHNVFRQGALKIFAPLVKDNWSGQNTGLSIQNVGVYSTQVTAEFYNYTDGGSVGSVIDWVDSKATTVFYVPVLTLLPTWIGLGTAEVRSNSEDIAGMVHEASNGRFMTHVMATVGSQTVYMPRQGRWSDASQVEWTVAAMIMNAGSQATDVTVRFYKENGDPDTGRDFTVQNLASHAGFSTWANVAGFKGSAVATSSGEPIVAAINYVNNAALGDTGASFNAPNR